MPTSISESYKTAHGPVKLSIVIGDAQLGTSVIKLGLQELTRGPDITGFEIGQGPKLAGLVLSIKSVVTDVNDKTQHTSITYLLTGGEKPVSLQLSEAVKESGDSIIYRATVEFK